ncbi:hypothetical protein PIB30_004980 [Stylosanthes scabra]|uniref:Uncharacterized protein n=1 Tax=Stylosanthes scabra TaxID=79078 RepID=A0ABU6X2C4_9FABA|nr:hypothetical protein [Stylosanthes scabra]
MLVADYDALQVQAMASPMKDPAYMLKGRTIERHERLRRARIRLVHIHIKLSTVKLEPVAITGNKGSNSRSNTFCCPTTNSSHSSLHKFTIPLFSQPSPFFRVPVLEGAIQLESAELCRRRRLHVVLSSRSRSRSLADTSDSVVFFDGLKRK